ncbi:hypothetical protein CCP2SC5_50011 [Azospirillaceae bacterium]
MIRPILELPHHRISGVVGTGQAGEIRWAEFVLARALAVFPEWDSLLVNRQTAPTIHAPNCFAGLVCPRIV